MNNLSGRSIVLISAAVITVVTFILLYKEQIAILYVLATLGLVAILASVAVSDLEGVNRNKEKDAR